VMKEDKRQPKEVEGRGWDGFRFLGLFLVLVILAGGVGVVLKNQQNNPEGKKEEAGGELKKEALGKEIKISSKIDINSASQEELESLPGIGPKKAQAIIGYRKRYGPFKTKSDIIKVKGIGEKTYQKIKDKIEAH